MGCDIHCYLEVYNEATKTWNIRERKKNVIGTHRPDEFYHGRNYSLFAWLGCTYRRPYIPCINLPRGLPHDTDPEIRSWFDIIGEHNSSYFTFEELLPYLEIDVLCEVYVTTDFMDYIRRDKIDFKTSDWWSHYSENVGFDLAEYELVTFTMSTDEFMGVFKDKIKEESTLHKNLNHVRIVFWFDN